MPIICHGLFSSQKVSSARDRAAKTETFEPPDCAFNQHAVDKTEHDNLRDPVKRALGWRTVTKRMVKTWNSTNGKNTTVWKFFFDAY